jgi:hypothetical protein
LLAILNITSIFLLRESVGLTRGGNWIRDVARGDWLINLHYTSLYPCKNDPLSKKIK